MTNKPVRDLLNISSCHDRLRGIRLIPFLCTGVLIMASSGAGAQDSASYAAADEIVVTGRRESTLDLKRLSKAQKVFRSGRVMFAPTSSLLFQIKLKDGLSIEGMTLSLRNGTRYLPVQIDGTGQFTLPDSLKGNWELVHNRGKGRIAIRPVVLSVGANEANRPLGDLRLQCRVSWELQKDSLSVFTRSAFKAVGGCSSARFAFYFTSLQAIAAANVVQGNRTESLSVNKNRRSYRAPLGDRTLTNGARIQLRYE